MKNPNRKLQKSRARRVSRVRARVRGTSERPRLSVHRTLKRISAQIIDDTAAKTLISASDLDVSDKLKKGKKPVEVANEVGKVIAKKALDKKIARVVFDRRDKRYHGRVKALAEGAREAGLQF